MSVRSLYNSIRDKLQLSVRVVSKQGDLINEGETFTLRCTVTNTASPASQPDDPHIVFMDPDILIRGGDDAKPKNGGGWHGLTKTRLHPNESDSVDVKFEATNDLPFLKDVFNKEDVANITANADLDLKELFNDFRVKEDFKHEIRKT